MPKRYPHLLIKDMLRCISQIQEHTAGIAPARILKDSWMCDAIVRNLEVIGEAARQMPEEIKQKYSQIPWQQISGLRNRLIHEYVDVDLVLVLEIVQDELPVLKEQLEQIHPQLVPPMP